MKWTYPYCRQSRICQNCSALANLTATMCYVYTGKTIALKQDLACKNRRDSTRASGRRGDVTGSRYVDRSSAADVTSRSFYWRNHRCGHQHQRETARRRYRVPRHDLVAIPAKQLYKFRGGERGVWGRQRSGIKRGKGNREGGSGRYAG